MKAHIFFFNWNSFYGKIIQFKTGSKWVHVGIGYEDDDSFIIYEAINKGLVKTVYSKDKIEELKKQGIVTSKTVDLPTTALKFKEICDKYEGTPYDWVSIFNIGFYFLFGKYILNFTGPRMLICSEFVARVLYEASNKEINFETEYNKPYDYIEPMDIYNSIQLQ